MIKNVIENYLLSIREVDFFGPFRGLLENLGFFDIHLLHGPTEFGKDFIAKKNVDGQKLQYCFQIKVGDINLNKFTGEIKPQLIEIITNNIAHPNYDTTLPISIVFVTTGLIRPPATISFQEFNKYAKDILKANPIEVWEKNKILNDFYHVGIEPFFELHNSPEFASRFFNVFAKIRNNKDITSFEIQTYTKNWLDLDFTKKENLLQVLFEGYFFSKLLFENEKFYESILFLSALGRALIKNDLFKNYAEIIISTINDNIKIFSSIFFSKLREDRESYLIKNSFFSIFSYPILCMRSLELLSLHILLSKDPDPDVLVLFDELINEKGSYRPISDNYGISVFFICLVLLRRKEDRTLMNYLTNLTVWLCDRYEQNGLLPVGYTTLEEYEQILSEYLSGLDYQNRATSFIAAIILDICAFLNDDEFYANIANDLRAVEIIPEYYHVSKQDQLYGYENVTTQCDHDFKITLDYPISNYIKYRDSCTALTISQDEAIILAFMLRDRYFPKIFLGSN